MAQLFLRSDADIESCHFKLNMGFKCFVDYRIMVCIYFT